MEVFVKEHEVPPRWIVGEAPVITVAGPTAILCREEEPTHPST
jgi:hypothetical protein